MKKNANWRTGKFSPTRREFLRRSGYIAGAALKSGMLVSALANCRRRDATSNDVSAGLMPGVAPDYGALRPTPDQNGAMILALPAGFEYATFSKIGDVMSDGNVVPRAHDGMACFEWMGDTVRLIRNHEVRTGPGASFDPSSYSLGGPMNTRYDAMGVGGTVTLEFDTRSKRLRSDFITLNGTIVNCAGGRAWRNSGWLSNEETLAGPNQGWEKKHGYIFFVPLGASAPVSAVPLNWMGRFEHEAAVAAESGVVYETEDAGNSSGFYRATPNDSANLNSGGKLEMLAIKGLPQARLNRSSQGTTQWPVEWVSIDTPDPDLENGALSCFEQGFSKGGAAFNRLEGIEVAPDQKSIYFVSTSGGDRELGQLWKYIPTDKVGDADQLELIFESTDIGLLESPDNLCVAPGGGILFCEDDAIANGDRHPLAGGIADVNRLIGMGQGGVPFEFAVNIFNSTEFAGVCFSPDGSTLFANIYGDERAGSGMTCAIWGPWSRGPL